MQRDPVYAPYMNCCVIICAAGASARYRDAAASEGNAAAGSKLDADLAGRPVLQRSVELFTKRCEVGSIVVAGPHDEDAFADFKLRHGDKLAVLGATLCQGGADHRWQTVAAALARVPDDATHIAVHDAARPGVPPELLDRLFDAAERHPAVIPALPVADTIKRTEEATDLDEPEDPLAAILGADAGKPKPPRRRVSQTLDRAGLVLVQTPQVFEAGLLRRAYAQPDLSSTDDAGLVEQLGEPVLIVEGDPRCMKITTPHDRTLLAAMLGLSAPQSRAAHKRF